MANIKLRPLVVHDSASSQSGFSDAYISDSSASVRAHCVLPSAGRAKLVPAPPDTGNSAAEDTGVSKLRSKLRKLLGAHSSSHGPAAQKGATPSQAASLRCSSTVDLNDRTATSSNGSRSPSSIPVSPSVAVANSTRARFLGTSIVVPNPSATSSPAAAPATPGSISNSPNLPGSRSGPVPPSPGPNGTTPTPRCPSANSNRGAPLLRRAVSFSPTATTFPPLSSPSGPTPASTISASGIQLPGAYSGGSSRTLLSSTSFVAGSGRMSSMVVVPENEALPEDASQGDYCLLSSAGSIVGLPHRPGHTAEFALRNGRISAADADTLPGVVPSSMPAFASPQYDNAPYVNTSLPAGGPSLQLSPARASPSGLDNHNVRRASSSSSSSTLVMATSGNGHVDMGPHGQSAPAPAASAVAVGAGLSSWSSDISMAQAPFQTATVSAAAAILEGSSPAMSSSSSTSPPHQHQQLRALPLKPTNRATAESGRPLSSSSASAAAAAAAAASRTGSGAAYHQPPSAVGGAPGASQPPVQPNHTSMPVPPLTRGMSAINLMPGTGGGGRGMLSVPGPWALASSGGGATATTVHAVAVPEAPATPVQQQPAGAAVDTRTVTPSSPKQQQQATLRRTHSTIDNTTRSQPEAPSGPPGVLMALGASLPSEMQRKEWRIEDFTMLKRLYKGNYSAVHKALCRISMRLVVIKTYDTTRMTELARNHVKREASLHAPLAHDNILNLYAVFSQGPYVMLVEEVAEGGDLYHVLKSIPGHRLQEDRAVAGVLVPLLRALSCLHEQGICHRDIKLENILFGDRQHTRMLLADFGIALSLRHERAVTRAGTTEYMSPEQLRCPFKRHPSDNKDRVELHYGLGVDVWATGVLAFELLHGYPPFLGSHREETEQLIMTAEVQVAPQLSHGARDFILSCLNKEAADRPTANQLLQHSWIRHQMRSLR